MAQTALAPPAPAALRLGLVLALALAAVDIVGTLLYLSVAPVAASVITLAIAAATLVGVVAAWRGAGWGRWLTIVTRVLAGLTLIPLFVVPEAPKETLPVAVVQAILTVVCLVLLVVGGRRRS